MSPILQSIANGSARGYGAFFGAAVATSFESIATVTVGSGGSSTITFSSIPSDFAHLQIRGMCRDGASQFLRVRFNSDTGNNYFAHDLEGNGSSVAAYGYTSISGIYLFPSGMSSTANIFSPFVIDILDYKNTNKNTTLRALTGFDTNGGGVIYLGSGAWNNTAAITSIDLVSNSSTFAQYSHFALYGIKSA